MAIELTRFSQLRHFVGVYEPRVVSTLRLLAIVEATTVNAVAKNVLEFHRTARNLRQDSYDFPGVDLSLVTFDRGGSGAAARPSGQSHNEFVVAARAAGVEIDVIPERSRFDRSVISALREVVQRRAPDLVITHQVKSHFLMKLSRLGQQYPWVAFHHGYTTTDQKMRLYNRLNRWSLPKADRVITVCQAFANELARAGVRPDQIAVRHNSIRPQPATCNEEVEALRIQLGIVDDERIALTVGRLSHEKAQIDLIQAFKNLCDAHPETNPKLVIVGDGPERGRLEAAASSLGIRPRVVFVGAVRDVAPYYAAADVLANPSHSEGSPYVLLEAMAAGLPIVATSVGGVPEMVTDDESALLVPAREPQAMSAAIARVLTNKDLAQKLVTNAATLVAARFSPESYVRSLIEIYREVILSAGKPCVS